PQQVRWRHRVRTFDGLSVLDERLDAAEARRPDEEFHPRSNGESFVATAAHAEGEHRAEAALHLLAGDRMIAMRFEARIEDALDLVVPPQEFGQAARGLGLRAYAASQRRETTADQPAVERRRDGACNGLVSTQPLGQLAALSNDHGAPHRVAVSAEVFRARMHD